MVFSEAGQAPGERGRVRDVALRGLGVERGRQQEDALVVHAELVEGRAARLELVVDRDGLAVLVDPTAALDVVELQTRVSGRKEHMRRGRG
jgi:hypothetical protein